MWLGLFAFKHVDYSHQLWWQFELHGEASRFLRASVGAAVGLLLFALARLMGPRAARRRPAHRRDLEARARVIAAQTSTTPYLVYLRDKAVLFDEDATGVRDVRRPGPHLGRAWRSGRSPDRVGRT